MARAEHAGKTIEALALTVESGTQTARQIADNMNHQISGMDQLTTTMQAIKQASTEIASSARQTEQSAHNLRETVYQMEEAVSLYQM